ncbi:restriction endonuclease [Deinococcus hohokamensis]|uniref:Restriction endonuclease n=1 Tax=Deinococcus hohokamensis TaxID=309883 RepID=A0ABV9IAG2_9DEIO
MSPSHLEVLVVCLLAKMRYVEVETTTPSHDGGVDMRAELTAGRIVSLGPLSGCRW